MPQRCLAAICMLYSVPAMQAGCPYLQLLKSTVVRASTASTPVYCLAGLRRLRAELCCERSRRRDGRGAWAAVDRLHVSLTASIIACMQGRGVQHSVAFCSSCCCCPGERRSLPGERCSAPCPSASLLHLLAVPVLPLLTCSSGWWMPRSKCCILSWWLGGRAPRPPPCRPPPPPPALCSPSLLPQQGSRPGA